MNDIERARAKRDEAAFRRGFVITANTPRELVSAIHALDADDRIDVLRQIHEALMRGEMTHEAHARISRALAHP